MFGKGHGLYQLMTALSKYNTLSLQIQLNITKMPTSNQDEEREDILPKIDEKGNAFFISLIKLQRVIGH